MVYDPTRPVWEQVTLDPELRGFVVLSPGDVSKLTIEALQQPDPAAWLSEQVARRGRAKRDAIERHNDERMTSDRAFFTDYSRWPYGGGSCAVKEQPWVRAAGRRYGRVYQSDFEKGCWTVHPDGEPPEDFPSLEELVKVWSVD